jgi:hypothetical protein
MAVCPAAHLLICKVLDPVSFDQHVWRQYACQLLLHCLWAFCYASKPQLHKCGCKVQQLLFRARRSTGGLRVCACISCDY